MPTLTRKYDAVQPGERLYVVLPDFDNPAEVEAYFTFLNKHTAVFGVRKLIRNSQQYLKGKKKADTYWKRIQVALAVVNGVRTANQKAGYSIRVYRNTIEKFYRAMHDPFLRQSCTNFNIDFDSFSHREDVIEALVNAHIAMEKGGDEEEVEDKKI